MLLRIKKIATGFVGLSEASVLLSLVVISIFFSIVNPQFLDVDNLILVARASSYVAIATIGASMVIITKGIDLSVGSMMGFAGITSSLLVSTMPGFYGSEIAGLGFGTGQVIILVLLMGLGIGVINGLMISYMNLPPFIVTLAMLNVLRGLCYCFTGGWPITKFPPSFSFLGQGFLWFIPMPVILLLGIAILAWWVMNKTNYGLYIYAVGGNEQAVRLSGINVKRLKTGVYAVAGLMGALAGIVLVSRLGVGDSTTASGYVLDVIAAAVIGGTSLSGGKGSVIGVVAGAVLLGIIRNGLVLLGVSAFYQQMAIGGVILVAIFLDWLKEKYSSYYIG